jgi:hypothetical protein
MTLPKRISASVTNILENPIVMIILDRNAVIEEVIETVQGWWGYDLMNRRPSPAYDEYGVFQGTDLDLACFMYALSERGAVINIPYYKSHSKTKIREDQELISKSNRNGKLIGVGGNKDFFNFNITIIDQNVVCEDKVGEARTFSLTDKDGSWYEGWNRIEFTPTIKENRFLTENKLWSGNRVVFKNCIHPNRWTSVFGQHYIITRLLMDRLKDESKFLFQEMKRLQAAGIEYPDGEGPAPFVETKYGDTISKAFPAFEMKVFIPQSKFVGEYEKYSDSPAALVDAYNRRKMFTYKIIPKLRFMTRASEFAHWKAMDRFPAWIKGAKWEDGFKIPRGRTTFQRLKLFQDSVGELSVSLLRREFTKKAQVSI